LPPTLAIASGKGGVGKTTVTLNLALGLTSLGLRVGVFDADSTGRTSPISWAFDARPPS
jgi:ATP-binding protein involved in chromosome partitioning